MHDPSAIELPRGAASDGRGTRTRMTTGTAGNLYELVGEAAAIEGTVRPDGALGIRAFHSNGAVDFVIVYQLGP